MADKGIIAALAEALPKLEGAKKNTNNPHFKAKYADLGSVIAALEPLKGHGLWFVQISKARANGACFETIVIHGPSGEQMSMGETFVPADRANAQGFGSAQTYARRYGIMSAFGLAAEDDDGHAASAAPTKLADKPKPVITEDQRTELISMFTHLDVPSKDFLAVAKVKDLRDLPAAWFEKAKKWINDAAYAKREAALKDGANAFADIDEKDI